MNFADFVAERIIYNDVLVVISCCIVPKNISEHIGKFIRKGVFRNVIQKKRLFPLHPVWSVVKRPPLNFLKSDLLIRLKVS